MPKRREPRKYKVINVYPEYATEEERQEAEKQKAIAMQEVFRLLASVKENTKDNAV